MAFPTAWQSFYEEFPFDLPMFAHQVKSVALASGSRRRAKGNLVNATKLQRAPSRNAAFMRQIWARGRLLPEESGVPVAVQNAPAQLARANGLSNFCLHPESVSVEERHFPLICLCQK